MMVKVKLTEIADEMDMQFDEMPAYLNRETGDIKVVDERDLSDTEDNEEDEEAKTAKEMLSDDKWIPLPDKFEIHDYQIMKNFCYSLKGSNHRNDLLNAISGRGAFRMFRAVAERLGLIESWYAFKKAAYMDIAKDWCEANGIEYE